jgi:hypothetical protein
MIHPCSRRAATTRFQIAKKFSARSRIFFLQGDAFFSFSQSSIVSSFAPLTFFLSAMLST